MFWEKKNDKKSLPELPPLKFSLPQKIIPKEEFSESDQKKVLNFAQKYPVKLKKISKIYRLVTQENQQSIIVRVHLYELKRLIF